MSPFLSLVAGVSIDKLDPVHAVALVGATELNSRDLGDRVLRFKRFCSVAFRSDQTITATLSRRLFNLGSKASLRAALEKHRDRCPRRITTTRIKSQDDTTTNALGIKSFRAERGLANLIWSETDSIRTTKFPSIFAAVFVIRRQRMRGFLIGLSERIHTLAIRPAIPPYRRGLSIFPRLLYSRERVA